MVDCPLLHSLLVSTHTGCLLSPAVCCLFQAGCSFTSSFVVECSAIESVRGTLSRLLLSSFDNAQHSIRWVPGHTSESHHLTMLIDAC